jgi:hypothetical protein
MIAPEQFDLCPGRLIRDSPYDIRSGVNVLTFRTFPQSRPGADGCPVPRAARAVVEGLIWPIFLGIRTHSSRSCVLEWVTSERLTLALAAVAESDAAAHRSLAAFQQSLRDLSWSEGRNLRIEYRWEPPTPAA